MTTDKNLSKKLETEEDLQKAFDYFYDEKQQKTGLSYLRFGQFIFNTYTIEWKNSYTEKDPLKAFELISELLFKLKIYNEISTALSEGCRIIPEDLSNV